jgi:hypothetical protein
MGYIERALVDNLRDDMIKWRGLAYKNYMLAKEVQKVYLDKYEAGGFASKTDAERSAATDVRFTNAVANNQMYDRFTARDAAVLSALLKMVELGLMNIKGIPARKKFGPSFSK